MKFQKILYFLILLSAYSSIDAAQLPNHEDAQEVIVYRPVYPRCFCALLLTLAGCAAYGAYSELSPSPQAHGIKLVPLHEYKPIEIRGLELGVGQSMATRRRKALKRMNRD